MERYLAQGKVGCSPRGLRFWLGEALRAYGPMVEGERKVSEEAPRGNTPAPVFPRW